MNNVLKVFEKDTSAPATNRGFLFQYLHTLNEWLNIYSAGDRQSKILCEFEDDIYCEKGDSFYFKQVKCYKNELKFSSPKVNEAIYNYFIIDMKYGNKDLNYFFITNKESTDVIINNWEKYKASGFKGYEKDTIESIKKSISSQCLIRKDSKVSSISDSKSLSEVKKVKIEEIIQSYEEITHKIDNYDWISFCKKINFYYENKTIDNFKEELIRRVRQLGSVVPEDLIYSRMLQVIAERSCEDDISNRELNYVVLDSILKETKEQILLKLKNNKIDIQEIKNVINSTITPFLLDIKRDTGAIVNQVSNLSKDIENIKEAVQQINTHNRKINTRINEFDLTYPAPKVCPEYLDRSQIEDIIRELRECDNHILLHGVGGIGKSTILRKLYSILKNEFDCIMWLEYNKNLLHSFRVVQASCIDENALLEKIKEHLRMNKNQRNLIFVDNVNEAFLNDQVYKEIERSATFVVTSRITDIVGFKPYEIKPFSIDEGITIFERYYGKEISEKEKGKIRTLFVKIDKNTLVMELIARAAKKEFMSFDIFLDKLINDGVKISQAKIQSGHDDKKDCIVGHLQNLYKVIDLDEEKKKILFNFIGAPDHGMNFELMKYLEVDNEALEELIDYGWISRDDFGFKMHSLIKNCIELQCEDFKKYAKKYIELYSTSNLIFAIQNSNDLWTCLEVLVKMVNLIEIENLEEMFMFYNILAILGYFHDEESLNNIKDFIIEKLNKFKDDEDYSELDHAIKSILVWGYGECGNYDMAFKYNSEVEKIIKMKFPDDYERKANCYHNFGSLFSKSDFGKSLSYFQESKNIYIKYLGEDSLKAANVNYNIAELNYVHNNIEEALNFAKQSLKVFKNKEVSIELANIKRLMGNLLSEQYKVNQDKEIVESAEDYLLEALKIYIDIWGENHPAIVEIKSLIADNLKEINRTQSALKLYICLVDDERYSIDVYPKIINLYFEDDDYMNWDKYVKLYLNEAIEAFGSESEEVKSIKEYIEKGNSYFANKRFNY